MTNTTFADSSLKTDDLPATRRREFDGKITHLFSGHGLIDNEVYFSFENVIGGFKPKVSDEVNVVACQHHAGGGWHAEKVIVSENWDDVDSVTEEVKSDELPSDVVGQVTHFDGITGYVNDYIYFDWAVCDCGNFVPQKGDWVKVNVSYDDGTRMSGRVTVLQPLREKCGEGVLSGELGNHGYIDGDIFYTADVLVNGFHPRKWDAVHYRAVESVQRKLSWRAVMVEPSHQPQLTKYFLTMIYLLVLIIFHIFVIITQILTEFKDLC